MKMMKRLAAVLAVMVIGNTMNIQSLNIQSPFVQTIKAAETTKIYYDEPQNTTYAEVSYDEKGMPQYDFTHMNIDWSQIPEEGLFPLKEQWKKPTEEEFIQRIKDNGESSLPIIYYDESQYTSVADFVEKNDMSSKFALIIKEGTTQLPDFNRYASGCKKLSNVKYAYIPESVTTIQSATFFKGFSGLEEVILSSRTTQYTNTSITHNK